jgi:hypothetical protein
MLNFSARSAVAETNEAAPPASVGRDNLLFFESRSTGKEFDSVVPAMSDRRASALRRDAVILKTWRGVPTDRGEKASLMIRNGMSSSTRNFETQRVIESERMFVAVLGTMTVMLVAILIYFVMNFHF